MAPSYNDLPEDNGYDSEEELDYSGQSPSKYLWTGH